MKLEAQTNELLGPEDTEKQGTELRFDSEILVVWILKGRGEPCFEVRVKTVSNMGCGRDPRDVPSGSLL